MKKTYIIPTTDVILVATQSICALSGGEPESADLYDGYATEGADGLVKENDGGFFWDDIDWDE